MNTRLLLEALFLLLACKSDANAFSSSFHRSSFLSSSVLLSTKSATTFDDHRPKGGAIDREDDEDDDPNPMWPDGVAPEGVDALVDDILDDKNINLPQLPDFLERQLYRTTILITLNAVYRLLGNIHGRILWGHSIELSRDNCDQLFEKLRTESIKDMISDVDEGLLEEVADQLLSNQAINQPLVPDVVERQLYVNCLKIVFRILNMLAASFRITLCGHDITLQLEKSTSLKKVAIEASSSETPIDTSILKQIARANVYHDTNSTETKGIWKSSQREFIVQVNTVLYSLILGILDDLLANTQLEIMTDRITFDIVPPEEGEELGPRRKGRRRRKEVVVVKKSKPNRVRSVAVFVLGAAFGIATNRFLV